MEYFEQENEKQLSFIRIPHYSMEMYFAPIQSLYASKSVDLSTYCHATMKSVARKNYIFS